MAGTTGNAPDPVAVFTTLQSEPSRFTLFAALRMIEQAFPSQPRFGDSRRPADDAVRIGQPPHLVFAPSDVASFEQADGERPRLGQYSFGIFGPNGALPLHLTEYCYQRLHQLDDPSLSDFVNLFQHRLASLFYRAWANADPATNMDRPASDRFVLQVGALLGLGTLAAQRRDAVLDYAKLHRCGLFSQQARSAEGLQSILCDYFALPITVRQFVGEWLDIPRDSVCRMGGKREYALLGQSATLGAASWQCQHKFEVVVGPLTLTTFGDFLPGNRGLRELYSLVRLYTNDEWSWQARLLLRDVDIPGIELGRAGRLGWTTWLGRRDTSADDVVLQGDNRWLI